ncbi:MAG TPA: hypothetical protein VK674_03475 [Candidatus Limnocylindria bacterium]|nr:hypothetical protein [Candidatus Limnocylindria bacterium]
MNEQVTPEHGAPPAWEIGPKFLEFVRSVLPRPDLVKIKEPVIPLPHLNGEGVQRLRLTLAARTQAIREHRERLSSPIK